MAAVQKERNCSTAECSIMTTINILVVGDDEEACNYLAKMLSAKDWQTDIAWVGSKALDLARKNAYDAIVFDYRKPGLDGADVCRRIRRSQPEARIVCMTGTQDIDTVYRTVEAGADRVLAKPVDPRNSSACSKNGRPEEQIVIEERRIIMARLIAVIVGILVVLGIVLGTTGVLHVRNTKDETGVTLDEKELQKKTREAVKTSEDAGGKVLDKTGEAMHKAAEKLRGASGQKNENVP